eukprot:6492318-Amphidinium_carterae.1
MISETSIVWTEEVTWEDAKVVLSSQLAKLAGDQRVTEMCTRLAHVQKSLKDDAELEVALGCLNTALVACAGLQVERKGLDEALKAMMAHVDKFLMIVETNLCLLRSVVEVMQPLLPILCAEKPYKADQERVWAVVKLALILREIGDKEGFVQRLLSDADEAGKKLNELIRCKKALDATLGAGSWGEHHTKALADLAMDIMKQSMSEQLGAARSTLQKLNTTLASCSGGGSSGNAFDEGMDEKTSSFEDYQAAYKQHMKNDKIDVFAKIRSALVPTYEVPIICKHLSKRQPNKRCAHNCGSVMLLLHWRSSWSFIGRSKSSF